MTWLAGQYPDLFNQDAPRPLAVGIGKIIVAASPDGNFRYNLDNLPAGAIIDRHRHHARLLLEEKEASKGGG